MRRILDNGLTSFFRRGEKAPPGGGSEARGVGRFLVDRGSPLPLGPSLTSRGANFAVVASRAVGMRLELFADDFGEPLAGIDLDPRLNRTGHVWHIRV
ncbi:MAG: hypothetical protein LBU23_01185, partial [Planctomycetota bacterium]|nr:hypothetical protein [Planctomycetota bacterium]